MQNGKCHLSCLRVKWIDTAYSDGSGTRYIVCNRDEKKRKIDDDCPYANELEMERLTEYIQNMPAINPTVTIFRAMNNMNNYQKGQKETMQESNTERHKRVCYELNALYDRKNRDYGDSFHESWKDYGITMAAIRIGDKYNRFKNLTSGNAVQNVADESVRDTLIDLANYAIMTLMELDAETESPKYEWTKEEQK